VPFSIFKPLKSRTLVKNVKLKKRPLIIYLRILPKLTSPTVDFLPVLPHHYYAAPVENFDAALAPTLLYNKAKFLKRTKV
jgi:hypothetical protein